MGRPQHSPRFVRLVLHVVPAVRQAAADHGDLRDQGNHSAEDEARRVGRAPLMRGIVAHFRELDSLCEAIEDLKKEKFHKVTVYTPTPRHEIDHAVKAPTSIVRRFTLIGALSGATFGYWVAIWTSEYWPLQLGGKAYGSWIPYTIIAFEMMVLIG